MQWKRPIKCTFIFIWSLLFFVPLLVTANTSGVSGLAVAKYKLEGAETKRWTDLPIQNPNGLNTFDITLTKPGITVVTLYAEDRAGNQNYEIKSFRVGDETEDAPVDYIEYRLSGATEQGWTRYTGPFVITREGETVVEARIVDRAGNVTTITETIRIDKTSPVNTKAVIRLE